MDDEYLKKTCKIGQGDACCKYLMMSLTAWECAKVSPIMKATIDDRELEMTAKGDNCQGFQ